MYQPDQIIDIPKIPKGGIPISSFLLKLATLTAQTWDRHLIVVAEVPATT
jgi:hypothetical protein